MAEDFAPTADDALTAVGCDHCTSRRRSTYARVLELCYSCSVSADMPGEPSPVTQLAVVDWVPTVGELCGYLTSKTTVPWLVVQWRKDIPSKLVTQVTKLIVRALPLVVGTSEIFYADKWHKQVYFVPDWVNAFLNGGKLLQEVGLNKGKDGVLWPRVIEHAKVDVGLRRAIMTTMDALQPPPTAAGTRFDSLEEAMRAAESLRGLIREAMPEAIGVPEKRKRVPRGRS